jgi:hypothetical protein
MLGCWWEVYVLVLIDHWKDGDKYKLGIVILVAKSFSMPTMHNGNLITY